MIFLSNFESRLHHVTFDSEPDNLAHDLIPPIFFRSLSLYFLSNFARFLKVFLARNLEDSFSQFFVFNVSDSWYLTFIISF